MRQKPIDANKVAAPKGQTVYPEPFASQVKGRTKRKLGDVFGLNNFGVNLSQLEPGAISALFHYHTKQDEFLYILEGTPIVVIGDDEYVMTAGECIGFKAGTRIAHQLINRTAEIVTYLEIGDRTPNDDGDYPNDDIKFYLSDEGTYEFTHKDGTPY